MKSCDAQALSPRTLLLSSPPERAATPPDILRRLEPATRARILALGQVRDYRKGELLFRQGDPHEGIFLIEAGMIKSFYASEDARELTLGFWSAGHYVGAPQMFGGGPPVGRAVIGVSHGELEESTNVSASATETNYGTLYKTLPAVRHAIDPEAQLIAAECAFAELARTGSTTVVELGYDYEVGGDGDIAITHGVAETAMRLGLRCYSAPRFRAMHYGHAPDGQVWYEHYPQHGRTRFRDCVDFCSSWNGRFDGRLRTMLAPGQIDTCDPEMLRDTRRVADAHKLPIQVHAGQSPNEYARIRSQYGMSTVEYMLDTGMLGPDCLIGHGQIMTADGDMSSLTANEDVDSSSSCASPPSTSTASMPACRAFSNGSTRRSPTSPACRS